MNEESTMVWVRFIKVAGYRTEHRDKKSKEKDEHYAIGFYVVLGGFNCYISQSKILLKESERREGNL